MKKLALIWIICVFAGKANAELFELRSFETRAPYSFFQFQYGQEKGIPFAEAFSGATLGRDEVAIRLLGSFSQATNDQLLSYYRERIPLELEEALQSSGNLHNPAISRLRKNFAAAFRETAMYKNIETELAKLGYIASEIEFEKFSMNTKGNPKIWVADIWLRFIISPNKSNQ